MAKSIKCKDVGMDCDFHVTGETIEDVLRKAAEHAKDAHGIDTFPPELAKKVKAAIQDK